MTEYKKKFLSPLTYPLQQFFFLILKIIIPVSIFFLIFNILCNKINNSIHKKATEYIINQCKRYERINQKNNFIEESQSLIHQLDLIQQKTLHKHHAHTIDTHLESRDITITSFSLTQEKQKQFFNQESFLYTILGTKTAVIQLLKKIKEEELPIFLKNISFSLKDEGLYNLQLTMTTRKAIKNKSPST